MEDETAIAETIAFNLEREGYRATIAADGRTGLQLAMQTPPPDLVVLDLMLPEMDGIEVCRTVRAAGLTIPIIMLTARGGEADRVLGLEMGADDYVTKPFSLRELMARIRSVLRRSEPDSGAGHVLALANLRLDLEGHEVWVDDRRVDLSAKEFELLRTLVRHRGQVLSRDQLLNLVWGQDFYGDPRKIGRAHV